MVEVRGLLLLNQVFEDADIFSLVYFDSEYPIGVVTAKKAVEREKLCGIKIDQEPRLSALLEGSKVVLKEKIVVTYLAPLL